MDDVDDRILDMVFREIEGVSAEIKDVKKEVVGVRGELGTILKSHNGRMDELETWKAVHEERTDVERKSRDRSDKWRTTFVLAFATIIAVVIAYLLK